MNLHQGFQKSNILFKSKCSLKKTVNRLLLLCAGCLMLNQVQAQADKRLELADQYFAAGEYYTAAGLYGQFLNPDVKEKPATDFPLHSKKNKSGKMGSYENKLAILFKQAESYRLAHYWTEAAALYKECFEKDAAQFGVALYWFGVCQRSLGNYTVAEESINRFVSEQAGGHPFLQAAEQEKNTLEFIRGQLARPDSVLYSLQKLGTSFETEKGFYAPMRGSSNQVLITSTQTDPVVVAGNNPHHNRLFTAVLVAGSLQNIQQVVIQNNDSTFNQGAASISADGRYLYFTQWKKEQGQSGASIYYSGKTENGWSQPALLHSVNQQGSSSKQPFCSVDGKYLFFASDREGGMGNFDIWYAPLQADGQTGEPVNAGSIINTPGNEQAPFYHNASSTLVFSSDRMPGMGGYDLFMSRGKETNWNAPENLGYPVNSSRDDVYFSAFEKDNLLTNAFFSSDRGSECCLATYSVSKASKKKMLSGIVYDCKDNEPVVNAEVNLKTASGKTITTITGEDGRYLFELGDGMNPSEFLVNKEKYNEKNAGVTVETNKTGWLTDTLFTAAICMEKKLVIKVENVVTVYFDFDQSKLKDRGIAQLDSIYTVLTENPTATIQISGYTDGLGSVEYNQVLSDKRARACADYLVEKGIDAARISFESFGACCPVEMEMLNGRDNPDGRSMNRRALINIDKGE